MTLATGPRPASRWRPVCATTDLAKGHARALHVDGRPVALFRTCDGDWFALADVDPGGGRDGVGALSAGTLAYRRDVAVVLAARSGRRFDLASGHCLDDDTAAASYPVRVTDGAVELGPGSTG